MPSELTSTNRPTPCSEAAVIKLRVGTTEFITRLLAEPLNAAAA